MKCVRELNTNIIIPHLNIKRNEAENRTVERYLSISAHKLDWLYPLRLHDILSRHKTKIQS